MMFKRFLITVSVLVSGITAVYAQENSSRTGFWVDLYDGEPVAFDDMMDDVAESDVVYLGEVHRLKRHHDLQLQVIQDLQTRGKKVLLGIEQMEYPFQSTMDEYNEGKITYEKLVEATEWEKKWKNYLDYRAIVESVKENGGKVAAINAPNDIVRKVGREGLDSLSTEERSILPETMQLDDPVYEQWLNQLLLVHMPLTAEKLKPVFHAQVCRDETMAFQLAKHWKSIAEPEGWIAVVLCGGGHCSYGLGTPARFKRLVPDSRERIIRMTESGDTELTEHEKAMMRDIEISHESLRFIQTPIADYLHAVEQKPEE